MSEIQKVLGEAWTWIVTAFGGVSLAGIISAVIYGCLKGAFNKTIAKLDVNKIADEATDKGVERVKEISFTHSIQPIVESELKKINEASTEVLKQSLADVNNNYEKLLIVIQKLAAYFDNSIGVTEQAKEELRQALADAEKSAITAESIVIVEKPTEEKKEAQKPNEPTRKATIER